MSRQDYTRAREIIKTIGNGDDQSMYALILRDTWTLKDIQNLFALTQKYEAQMN